jgi:hypothetical protein
LGTLSTPREKEDAGVARVRNGAVSQSLKHGRDARRRIGRVKSLIASGRGFSPIGDFFASAVGVDGLASIAGAVQLVVVESPLSLVSRSASCFL